MVEGTWDLFSMLFRSVVVLMSMINLLSRND